MKFLDMFSGTGSVGDVVKEYGHDVKCFDIDRRYGADFCADITLISDDDFIRKFGYPDVIWASIPCNMYSVGACSTHWKIENEEYIPQTKEAIKGNKITERLLELIELVNPRYFFIENPRGMLRKMNFFDDLDKGYITYCQYGDSRMKPTDIWGKFPPSLILREPCNNGDPCHEAAPRGAKTGTQGLSKDDRGKVPRELIMDIIEACERDMNYWLKLESPFNVKTIGEDAYMEIPFNAKTIGKDIHIEIPYNVAKQHGWDENVILSHAVSDMFI